MENRGREENNGSQFLITFEAAPQLDGKKVLFGEVVEGKHVVRAIRDVGSPSGTPLRNILITRSGELPM